mmetsp:Transcript_47006/g.110746  ORF Transcript_47006/g.110746 Transcript_47006/m.110746 type:complete len:208 (+) Transcript_47006:291-914(+)
MSMYSPPPCRERFELSSRPISDIASPGGGAFGFSAVLLRSRTSDSGSANVLVVSPAGCPAGCCSSLLLLLSAAFWKGWPCVCGFWFCVAATCWSKCTACFICSDVRFWIGGSSRICPCDAGMWNALLLSCFRFFAPEISTSRGRFAAFSCTSRGDAAGGVDVGVSALCSCAVPLCSAAATRSALDMEVCGSFLGSDMCCIMTWRNFS